MADKHSGSVAQLALQYRMHEEICQLSNDLVYKGRLRCANDSVRRQQLNLAGFPENIPSSRMKDSVWIATALDPSKPVVFLNTDNIKPTEGEREGSSSLADLERTSGRGSGGNIVNDTEAALVSTVVDALVKCGLPSSCIGVVCPFRAQVSRQEAPKQSPAVQLPTFLAFLSL